VLDALRGRRAAGALGVLMLSACWIAGPAVAGAKGATAGPCTPGSGRQLAGKHVTPPRLERGGLQCADLSGANLSGLDLVQDDLTSVLAPNANFSGAKLGQATLTGAVLHGANLQDADLTQATMTGADLSGANLNHATLDQVEAEGVNLSGADLSDASLIQATLNNANLATAKVSGADFTQAELSDVNFDGVRGLTDWSRYLLIGAAVIFLLLAAVSVRRAVRRGPGRPDPSDAPMPMPMPVPVPVPTPAPTSTSTPITPPTAVGSVWQQAQANSESFWQQRSEAAPGIGSGMSTPAVRLAGLTGLAGLGGFNPINGPSTRGIARGLVLGLLGSLLVAFGAHLFVGGILGEASFAFDTLATAACSGPQCAVGQSSGTLGITVGIFVVLAGFAARASA
jgi:uncharacterized protein YjbI with pentapeptide repeats